MNLKNLLPRHKSDFSTMKALEMLEESDFEKIGFEILEWFQDINWPIARQIRDLVISKQRVMMDHILTVLNGDDEWWKYWIITNILPLIEPQNLKHILPRLNKIYNHPTPGEIEVQVYDEVVNFLHDHQYKDIHTEISRFVLRPWTNGELPFVGGLLLKNGKIYKNIRTLENKTNKHLIYNYFVDIKNSGDSFESIDIFQKIENTDFKIYCGDSSHGSFGYILVLNGRNEFEFLLFDEINPIVDFEIKNNVIHALNNCGQQFILPLDHPEHYQIKTASL